MDAMTTKEAANREMRCSQDEPQSADGRKTKNIIFFLTAKAFVAFLDESCTLRQGLEKMKHHGYTAMPVVAKDGTYVGTVSEGDFLWHVLDRELYSMESRERVPLSDVLRPGWNPAVSIRAPMDEMLLRSMDQNFVPVVDDRGKFIGIITRRNIIKHYYEAEQED